MAVGLEESAVQKSFPRQIWQGRVMFRYARGWNNSPTPLGSYGVSVPFYVFASSSEIAARSIVQLFQAEHEGIEFASTEVETPQPLMIATL